MKHSTFFLALALALHAKAHMQLSFPPPFRSTLNPYANQNTVDYSMTSPITAAQFPCKGYQTDFSDSKAGTPTASFSAGGTGNITLIGGATHGGGSCQIALSYDVGKTFTVIQSIEGNCPTSSGQDFNFEIPSDAPTGKTMLAWVWYNKIGNREIYMNCASVTIEAASGSSTSPKSAFSSRPSLFLANLDNGCTTVEGTDVKFPDPGPDLTGSSTDSSSFTGTCQAVDGIGSESSGSSASNASQVSAGTTGVAAATSQTSTAVLSSTYAATNTDVPPTIATSTAAPSTNGSMTTTSDGQCSGAHTCEGSIHGSCCSQWGWCGSTSEYCGSGCQAGFGSCGSSNDTSASTGSSESVQVAVSVAATNSYSAAPSVTTITQDVSTVFSTSTIIPSTFATPSVSTHVVGSGSAGAASSSGLVGNTLSSAISGFMTVTTAVSTPSLSGTSTTEAPAPPNISQSTALLITIIPLTSVAVSSSGKVTVT